MGWLRLVGYLNYTSLLQNIVSFIRLFCKRDLEFKERSFALVTHARANDEDFVCVQKSLVCLTPYSTSVLSSVPTQKIGLFG